MLRNRVQEFRELHGLTQTELAERSGVQRQVIGNLESIEGYLTSMSTAVRLCRYFRVDVGRMFWIDWAVSATEEPQIRDGELEQIPA